MATAAYTGQTNTAPGSLTQQVIADPSFGAAVDARSQVRGVQATLTITAGAYLFTHSLGSTAIEVEVRDPTTGIEVDIPYVLSGVNAIIFKSPVAIGPVSVAVVRIRS